jgi:DNA-binding protein YbaB
MERLQESRPRYEPPIEIQTNARHERHFNTQMLNIEIRHAINRRRECDIAAVKVYIEDNCFSLSTLVTIKYKLTNGTRRMNQIEISNELLERCDQNRLMNMLKRFIIQTFNGGGRNAETNNT